MGRFLFSAFAYLLYLVKRKDEYSLHSPFLFDFYTSIVKNKHKHIVPLIENQRAVLLVDKRDIPFTECGASKQKNTYKTIASIAQKSLSTTNQASFLGALCQSFNPKTVLEIGTSLGITTSYLAHHAPEAFVYTLEGNDAVANMARMNWKRLGYQNIISKVGDFTNTLPEALKELNKLDFVFFDGNHQYQPTMAYFQDCLPLAHEKSLFVFHDIYWSEGMQQAWREIINHSSVMLSLDFYYLGVVFFKKDQPKQHFVLKF